MKLAIFSEAGFNYGYGHFYRMSGICEHAIREGGDVIFYLMADKAAKTNLTRDYVRFVEWKDPDVFKGLLDSETTLVVDSYHVDIKDLEQFQKHVRDMVVIDDNNRLDYHDMKILNPNYFAICLEYPQDRNNELFLGKDYTLLRDEFTSNGQKEIKETVTDILITMGGTDPMGRTASIIRMIRELSKEVRLHVVCTKAYQNLNFIQAELNEKDRLYLNIGASEMCDLMKCCDFAVASAGQTTNELIKMMCPAVLVAVVDNQMINTKYLSDNGYIEAMYEDDRDALARMFSYDKRKIILEKLQTFYSMKSGKDFIYELAFRGGDNGQ
ncbi:MAG: hypothetical protein MJ128_03735 [Mogibacterium sp.]|nr:hypothetical protein [Mogibacterium sp.]